MPRIVALCALVACVLAPRAAATSTIDIQTTGFETFMQVDVVIVDAGGGCFQPSFLLFRREITSCEWTAVATFPRQPGTTVTHEFFDGPLAPSRTYVYWIQACEDFEWASSCGYNEPIQAVATTTPAPAYLGRGFLRGNFSFDPCPTECGGGGWHDLPPDAWQYVGTDVAVDLYGGSYRDCSYSWALDIVQVVPAACTVAVEQQTWSRAKSFYR